MPREADRDVGPPRRSSCKFPPPEAECISDEEASVLESLQDAEAEDDEALPQPPGSPDDSTEASTSTDEPGVAWSVKVMTDDFNDPRHAPGGRIKPLRPVPMIKVSDLVAGLGLVEDRWIFKQPLNSWPGLQCLELNLLTRKYSLAGMMSREKRVWKTAPGKPLPEKKAFKKGTRATFFAPAWTGKGFGPDSPGFVWWFTPQKVFPRTPKKMLAEPGSVFPEIVYGEKMLAELDTGDHPHAHAKATKCHAFAHRYPVEKETLQDRNTWHAGVLIEWDHGRFTTLAELAWIYGCGGYGGRSNWCEDKLEPSTELYKAMPDSMKCPWDAKRSEVRLYDMPMKNKDEFYNYLIKYSNTGQMDAAEQRFLDPVVYGSKEVRLRYCTPSQLAGYLLNYMSRAWRYEMFSANCQTFAADLFGFLAGQGDAKPYGKVVQAKYQQRTHSFLYVPKSV